MGTSALNIEASTEEKMDVNKDITKRFIAVMYQLILEQKVRSRKEFAEEVGIKAPNLYRMYSSPNKNVPLYALQEIANKYNVSLEYIICGKGKMFKNESSTPQIFT